MSLKKKIEALDEFFGYLIWFAGVIIEILLVASFVTSNLLIFAIPVVAFLLWTVLIVWAYRARMKFRNRYEMRFLETARAYDYFICLAFTMTANGIYVFYQSSPMAIFIIPVVGIGLSLIVATLVKLFFAEHLALFEEEQKKQFVKILYFASSATIYYSLAVSIFDFVIFQFLKTNIHLNIFAVSLMSVVYLFPVYMIYNREENSRKQQESLAISLQETRLKNKFETKQKQKKRRKEKLSRRHRR